MVRLSGTRDEEPLLVFNDRVLPQTKSEGKCSEWSADRDKKSYCNSVQEDAR